ncbi:Asp-tRNA(Asn)/Glu-tRNA(Gln) amidotransferase subunit GatA [Candidatus Falkowbacteria bacterium]|nr:Asp-tRNA(Asn)/Glu-tRNA(Gln) amidotransferase subunit GatA [Candidatus Falkowbacteria bacterium]
MSLNALTLKEAHEGLKTKQFSAGELLTGCLEQAKKINPQLNAYITIAEEPARAAVHSADKLISSGEDISYLTGIPVAIKDALCTKGIRSTGAAKILDNYIPPYDATVIKRIRESGGVIIGKNNCDAFGHGASNENSQYGPVKNPWNLTKVPGGSSGGSAAALAADSCIYAIGEDTGGSIRQPASFCGVVGLKVSYGRNSRYGVMPMASSLDTVGPMSKTVWDAAAIMETIAGHDPLDSTTFDKPIPQYTREIERDIKGLTVGLPREYFAEGLDDESRKIIATAIKQLEELGVEIVEVSLPHTKYAIAVYYIVVPSEDSANLSRLDGIRYGVRSSQAKDLFETYTFSRRDGFPEEVKRRIMIGTFALSHGYYDAYYTQASKVRTLIKQDFTGVFAKVDALLTPVSPFPPFDLGAKVDDPLAMYLADIYMVPVSLAGVCGLSVPCGFTADHLPVGMQLVGPALGEDVVLRLGHQYQQVTDWHTRKPSL